MQWTSPHLTGSTLMQPEAYLGRLPRGADAVEIAVSSDQPEMPPLKPLALTRSRHCMQYPRAVQLWHGWARADASFSSLHPVNIDSGG